MRQYKFREDETEQFNQKVKFWERQLRDANIPYRIEMTKSKIRLFPLAEWSEVGGIEFLVKGFSGAELNFIKKVKKYFAGLDVPIRLRPYSEQARFWGNTLNLKEGEYQGIIEIDVNSAYWEAANKLGYLSPDIYREGKDETRIRKKLRLVSLGALAKKTTILEYDRVGELTECSENVCDLEIFWDNITYYFGMTMERIKNQYSSSVIGYWVDAFFVREESAAMIKQEFKADGYEVKIIPIEKLEILPDKDPDRLFIRRTTNGQIKDLPSFRASGERGKTLKAAFEQMRMEFEKMAIK
jgi:hypothetical protein